MRLARAKRPLLPLLLAAAIPVLLLSGWMAYRGASERQAAARELARVAVSRVAERIKAEISEQVEVMRALALSVALDEPDLPMFYREAQRLKDTHPLWNTVELDDPSGAQIMNLLRPLGAPLGATADRDSFDELVRDRRAVIGGIGPVGPVSGRKLVALRVPVVRRGDLQHVLTVEFVPNAVTAILREAGIPRGWIGAVVDGRGNLVARSLAGESSLGQPASPMLRDVISKAAEGVYRGQTLEGADVETMFKTLPDIGRWSVHLGIPSEELDRPVRRSMYAIAGGVLASLALAGGLTAFVSHEITRQRQEDERHATTALQESEERAALAVEAAKLGTWFWDHSRDEVKGSERCRALLALPPANGGELRWSSDVFLANIVADDRSRIRGAAQRCLETAQVLDLELRVRDLDGGLRWLRAQGRTRGPACVIGVIADIETQKRAEAERLKLLRRLAQAQEDVQRRIARELHDQIGQTVTGLSLGLKRLERSFEGLGLQGAEAPAEAGRRNLLDQVRWLEELTGEIGRDIHRVAADLRPMALDDLGLSRALEAHAAEWSRRHGIAADVQLLGGDESRLSAEIETLVYRVVQEALTNIVKHAGARHVSIVLERRRSELRILVEDDGVGFDPEVEKAAPANGAEAHRPLGLSGMRERLGLVRGTLRIESAPGAGTTLFALIPLASPTDQTATL